MRVPDGDVPDFGRPFVELSREICAAILVTMIDGWECAVELSDVNPAAKEVPLTERLRDGMRRALKEKRHPWAKSMAVLPGTESRSDPSVVVPDGRTDIPVFSIEIFMRLDEHDPHAIVECKRVAGADAALCRAYVVEGIDRFRSGKYGRNHAVGFMAGYVLSGTVTERSNAATEERLKSGHAVGGLSIV